uniref:Uncharacterized protein n=1 Tax=Cacopsylla melanoneura TaxID=428564 RepID=A0A8D8ZHH1_9HEMI
MQRGCMGLYGKISTDSLFGFSSVFLAASISSKILSIAAACSCPCSCNLAISSFCLCLSFLANVFANSFWFCFNCSSTLLCCLCICFSCLSISFAWCFAC